MKTKKKKLLLLSAKVILAAVLLAWVLGRVHWSNYVVTRDDGRSHSVLRTVPAEEAPEAFIVRTGHLWWADRREIAVEDLQPTEGPGGELRYPRMGLAASAANLGWVSIALAFGGFGLAMIVLAMRMRYLLAVQGISIARWEVVRLTFLGQFFNALVPGTVGGDLIKAYYLAKHTDRKGAVPVVVFVDRVAGMTELTLLASVMLVAMLALRLAEAADLRPAIISVVVVLLCTGGFFLVLFSQPLRRALRLERFYRRLPLAHHMETAGEAVGVFGRRPQSVALAVAMTLLAHIGWVGGLSVAGGQLMPDVPWYHYFLYIPLIYIIGAVPITPGGVGVVENFFLLFFTAQGANPSQILALALLSRLVPVAWGLPGALVAVQGARLPDKSAMQAELGLEAPPPE